MTTRVFASTWQMPRIANGELVGRIVFVALLVAAPLLPEISSSLFVFPAVNNWWVCLPFSGLFLLVLADVGHLRRLYNLDLLVLLSFIGALGCYGTSRTLPVLVLYPPLLYLLVRMCVLARVGRTSEATKRSVFRPWLPWRWLVVGICVLAAVHVHWALDDPSTSDVGQASVQGAVRIVHGKALYGADRALTSKFGVDPHYDTYGPFNYEAYVPFTLAASESTAARLASLFFSLLTAALLYVLGRRVRGPTVGLALAFVWLAYPFTLYSDGFDFNDALVAATLVGALLTAHFPLRRGAMVALAGWTKLSPLALVPVMLAHSGPIGWSRLRSITAFCMGFLLTSALVFVPALDHNSLSLFITRSFGYQASRSPELSIWALFGNSFRYANWVVSVSRVTHGLLTALTVGFALALLRLPRRQGVVGLAGVSAAVLIALQICDGYYSFSYLLWFVPLVLVALALEEVETSRPSVSPPGDATGSLFDLKTQPAPLVQSHLKPA